jgi:putative ABC transport system permease protein
MRDRELREWRRLIRERADQEWRELSPEVVEELACHLADLHAAAAARGASDADARARALAALNAASFLEVSRRPRARHTPTGYAQDVRLAIRQLRASPLVSAVAILSLALGIGANTAIFSIVNSLLMRPLPVRQPQQLVTLTMRDQENWSNPIWEQIRDRPELFDGAFAWSDTRFNLASGGETEFVDGIWASGGLFDTLGVRPILGRTFTAADDRRGGGPDGPVAVISYDFWQRRFGGAADVVGRTLHVERVPFTVIGVTSPDFFGPEVGRTFDVAIPIGTESITRGGESWLAERSSWWLSIMARLKPGQSLDAANAALRAAQPAIRNATAPGFNNYIPEPFTLAPAATSKSALRRHYERPLIVVLTIAALVLLIACANIANLLLARATARHHEFSVRRALGASPWRLARQLVAESTVLSAAGAVAGIVVARWGSQFLVRQISTSGHRVYLDLSLDTRVLVFTIGVTIVTTLLFGVVPALRVAASEPMDAIKEHGRGLAARRVGLSGSLVVAQVALSLVLVAAATLFVRTFTSLANRDVGFDRARVLVVTVDAGRAQIDRDDRVALFTRMLERVRMLPGVVEAGLSTITPVSGQGWNTSVDVSDAPRLNGRQALTFRNAISPRWFAALGMRVVAGRGFTDSDRKGAPPVLIVNQAFVRRFLNGQDPIGRTVQRRVMFNSNQPNALPPPSQEIVGVVADAIYDNLRERVPPTMFEPLEQSEASSREDISLILRTKGSPMSEVRGIAATIGDVNGDLAITFRPLAEFIDASVVRERIVAMLAGFFGGLALLLASLGLFGLTSYTVERRRTEIGIRMALGAAPSGVIGLVLSGTTALVAIGIVVGGTLSLWAARFVGALLYQVEARDPVTLVSAAATLVTIAVIAAALPAYRASRIDPATVLRESQA